MLTLFHPRSGAVRIQGVTSATNAVLHPWLKAQCTAILATLPPPTAADAVTQTALWQVWPTANFNQKGYTTWYLLALAASSRARSGRLVHKQQNQTE
jgi:hypothetical protein